ncbi:MAG: hypothetical protein HYZ81_17570 [Nitrospinae bacterium]|nr:hypothetical protein [Nitrospinota bacterium]
MRDLLRQAGATDAYRYIIGRCPGEELWMDELSEEFEPIDQAGARAAEIRTPIDSIDT